MEAIREVSTGSAPVGLSGASPAVRHTVGVAGSQPRTVAVGSEDFARLCGWILPRVETALNGAVLTRASEPLQLLADKAVAVCRQAGLNLDSDTWAALLQYLQEQLVGYGPIDPLLDDDTITEIMVNGPDEVYIERGGKITRADVRFQDDDHVIRVIQRIVQPLGRRIDPHHPMVDARLPDGSRVNAIIPPCAIDGPSITIRKFGKKKFTADDLVRLQSLTPEMVEFLKACVNARLNIVVSGGTGSGKTTLLNVLSSFIPNDERIVTIEDSAELRLHQTHVVRLEAVPGEEDGTGRVTIRDLVRNALRMRPDRIVVGECRGGEALDMLQAMNTGHDGSLTTIHANSPRDAVARLETLVLMAGMDLPVRAIRQQIASAVDLIVQQARLRDGSRKVVQITEVQGMEGDTVIMQDVFVFHELGIGEDGKVIGVMKGTGIRPKFTPKLEAAGHKLGAEIFQAEYRYGVQPEPMAGSKPNGNGNGRH
ncbi:MAG: CpaF family protein [Anaerolineae bacterium]